MNKPAFLYITVIATTAEKLWEALTNPDITPRYFFGVRVESTWKVGDPVRYNAGDKITDEGVVLKCDPPRTLSYTFHHLKDEEMRGEKPSRVTFDITPEGQAVRLTVTHDDFPEDSKVLPGISEGWPLILSGLKTLLETGQELNLESTCDE